METRTTEYPNDVVALLAEVEELRRHKEFLMTQNVALRNLLATLL